MALFVLVSGSPLPAKCADTLRDAIQFVCEEPEGPIVTQRTVRRVWNRLQDLCCNYSCTLDDIEEYCPIFYTQRT